MYRTLICKLERKKYGVGIIQLYDWLKKDTQFCTKGFFYFKSIIGQPKIMYLPDFFPELYKNIQINSNQMLL